MMETIKRSCFLTFSEDSKTVKLSSKGGSQGSGTVTIEVTVNIPKSLFQHPVLHAKIDIPEGAGVSEEMIVDLKQALAMTYGKSVQLIVNPAETISGADTSKDSGSLDF